MQMAYRMVLSIVVATCVVFVHGALVAGLPLYSMPNKCSNPKGRFVKPWSPKEA